MPTMVEVEAVSKSFGATKALVEVSISIATGGILGLLGPNGAGKTTLVRILSTLLPPDRGRARVAGWDVVADAARVRTLIGLAGQYATVDELLTGRENLELVGLWYHLPKPERRRRADEVLERFDLAYAANRLVRTYSGGMRRRLDIGASLMGHAPVLFLDEPTAGLDPRTRNNLWAFITEMATGGTTVLLTTQYMEEAEHLAGEIVVLDSGRVVAKGTSSQLKNRLGGDVLEARVSLQSDLSRVAGVFTEMAGATANVDQDRQMVRVPTKGGTPMLLAIGRRLEDDGISLDDLGIRRPSLDDVFLAFTGSRVGESAKGMEDITVPGEQEAK
jgi:ABC-2 type transport system ATP-binding protein